MGDHHMFRKGYAFEGSARIPLLVAGPSDSGVVQGAALDEIVELRGLMPTLLECAGLPIPDGVEGRSLLSAMRGASAAPVADAGGGAVRERVRGHLHGEHALFGQSLQWITTDRWKYCWMSADGHEQLFDLLADPTETRDLASIPVYVEDWRGYAGC
jgi:arylsulfatase